MCRVHSIPLISIYFSVFLVSCYCALPKLINPSPPKVVDLNSTVEIPCTVQNAYDLSVNWLKQGDLLTTGTTKVSKNSKISIRHSSSGSEEVYTLIVDEMQETDEGLYECVIVVSSGVRISAEVPVNILKAPTIFRNSTTAQEAQIGQETSLKCLATGFPRPIVYWKRKDNSKLSTGASIYPGNTLKISPVTRGDAGVYQCIADNVIGRSRPWDVILDILS